MKSKLFLAAVLLLALISVPCSVANAQGTPNEDVGVPVENVPDAGATALLLGAAVGAVALARSRVRRA